VKLEPSTSKIVPALVGKTQNFKLKSGAGTQEVSPTMTETLVDKKPLSTVGISEFPLKLLNLNRKLLLNPEKDLALMLLSSKKSKLNSSFVLSELKHDEEDTEKVEGQGFTQIKLLYL
jgi:hypothetical protein